jgi:hypothetical protein
VLDEVKGAEGEIILIDEMHTLMALAKAKARWMRAIFEGCPPRARRIALHRRDHAG